MRLWNELGNGGLGAAFEGKDRLIDGIPFVFGNDGDIGQGHEAVDTLSGQISAVAKCFAFGWGFQNAGHAQAAAVVDDGEAVGLYLHHAVHGQLRPAADLNAVYFDPQIDKTVADVWLVYHQSRDSDIACAIVDFYYGIVSCTLKLTPELYQRKRPQLRRKFNYTMIGCVQ